jgi:hypothetical protein
VTAATIGAAGRRIGRFHEDPVVIARCQAWAGPVLSRLTPARRRALLALAALWVAIKRPLKDASPAIDLRGPNGPTAAAVVILLCLAIVIVMYVVARRFPALCALARSSGCTVSSGLSWSSAGWLRRSGAWPCSRSPGSCSRSRSCCGASAIC